MPKVIYTDEKLAQTDKKFPGLWWLLWVPWLVLLDQVSKWAILEKIAYGEISPLIPFINLTQSHNYGVAFSLLNQQAHFLQLGLLGFIILICIGVALYLIKVPANDKWLGMALTLILGGALGNLCDRLFHGYVIDFIDFYIRSWHWYTFNFADGFITIGALMLIKSLMKE